MKEYAKSTTINIMGSVPSTNQGRPGTQPTEVVMTREGFEPEIGVLLDRLWDSQTGKAVLTDLGSAPGILYIRP